MSQGELDRRLLRRTHETLASDVSLIASEFLAGFQTVQLIDRPAVSIFGSARVTEATPSYEAARRTAGLFADRGFAVVTGGGPGVMEAANRGCREAGGLSVGFNIVLRHEQGLNPYCDLSLTFKHFYARKTMFVKAAEGFVIFPGWVRHARRDVRGADVDPDREDRLLPGRALRQRLLGGDARLDPVGDARRRSRLPQDLALLTVTDDPAEVVETVVSAYDRRIREGTA